MSAAPRPVEFPPVSPEVARATEPWAPLALLYDVEPVSAPSSLDRSRPGAATPVALQLASARAEADETGAATHSASKKPLLYSLLLPGLGELSMGEKGRAVGFFIAEGLIWSSFAYWRVAGDLRQDDYIEQAALNAGVGVDEGSDDYWRIVGQYERSSGEGPGSYEEDLRREARDAFPDDPAAQDAYVGERLPTGDRAWEWTSPELQTLYRDTRESSSRAYNRAEYSFAAAILNRVVSVIDVQLLRRKASKEARASRGAPVVRFMADAEGLGGGVLVQRRF